VHDPFIWRSSLFICRSSGGSISRADDGSRSRTFFRESTRIPALHVRLAARAGMDRGSEFAILRGGRRKARRSGRPAASILLVTENFPGMTKSGLQPGSAAAGPRPRRQPPTAIDLMAPRPFLF
jgi:hypothetical protein